LFAPIAAVKGARGGGDSMQFKVDDVEMSIDTYGGTSSTTKIKVGDKVVYFSYNTPIAIFDGDKGYLNGKEYGKTSIQHVRAAKFAIFEEFNKVAEVLESEKFHEVCEFDEPINYKTKRAGDKE
jgi:hypothetical protein